MKKSPSPKTSPTSWLLRGSLIVLRRRCGKPNCRCAKGLPHATPALSWSQQGKTRILTLPPPQLPAVRAALRRYQQAQAQLERRAAAGLRHLAQQRTAEAD
jgi:hypothetical protein